MSKPNPGTLIPIGPTKLSQMENDEGFIDSTALPTKLSELQNDKDFIDSTALPTKLSDLQNDKDFIDSTALPTKLSDLQNDESFITLDDIPDIPIEDEGENPDYTGVKYDLVAVDGVLFLKVVE